ncbi:dihydrofolate reductase [Rhizobium phage RL2RES]|uniref:dihydrofolate reductase n=1 Tax=Rhizobium phage RL2RES TaxID=103371 RepID=A0A6B9J392_9CAUD|nr:dihydrofolate reductase [Rhizobium phage RL2RES]QGZ14223.1 dihydrofolate reductase [Rhizobium phage RL2RES]
MNINLIAAIGKSGQIGLNGGLPWQSSDDLRWFKSMTMDSLMIAGYRTYQTVKHLDRTYGRVLILDDEAITPDFLRGLAEQRVHDGAFIIGGAKTYTRWMPYIDRFYISRIDYDGPADTFFPDVNWRSL